MQLSEELSIQAVCLFKAGLMPSYLFISPLPSPKCLPDKIFSLECFFSVTFQVKSSLRGIKSQGSQVSSFCCLSQRVQSTALICAWSRKVRSNCKASEEAAHELQSHVSFPAHGTVQVQYNSGCASGGTAVHPLIRGVGGLIPGSPVHMLKCLS